MNKIHALTSGERGVLCFLFDHIRHRRAQIFSVIEGFQGTALVDSLTDPHVARLDYRVFTVFGGDPEHPLAQILVESLPSRRLLPVSGKWYDLLERVHGSQRLHTRNEYSLSARDLNIDHIRSLSRKIPEGIRIVQIDTPLARRMDKEDDLEDFKLFPTYPSPEDFVARGIGFCALKGDQIVCSAHSDAVTTEAIEIQIETIPDFRRQGIATAVGATLISYCLEHNLEPHWSAENKMSVGLATKLGYTDCTTYDIVSLL